MAIVINGSGTVTGISVGGLPDDIVDAGTLADNAVGLAQMASGTDGNIITYDTSGNPAVVATGSAGQVLTSAGADAVPTMAAAASGLNAADQWRMTSDFALAASGSHEITDNWARSSSRGAGSLGSGMTESSGVFTFPSTGYWLILSMIQFSKDDGINRGNTNYLYTTINNADYNAVSNCNGGIYDSAGSGYTNVHTHFIFDVTSTTDCKCKMKCYVDVSTEVTLKGNASLDETAIKFIRLGDT